MKTIFVFSLVALIALVTITSIPTSFAETINVRISEGSAVPECEETDECYTPSDVTIHPGDKVMWSNDDTAAHTVTSGTPTDGHDGKFDSSLFMAGETFSVILETLGEYPYFCMIHPWMTGNVFVTVGGGVKVDLPAITVGEGDPDKTTVSAMSSDGKVRVEITTTNPEEGKKMSLVTSFRDFSGGGLINHVNYDILAIQNGKTVLSDIGTHEHDGTGTHMTTSLQSEDPVALKITINGFGLPGEENKWTGPKGEMVTFKVVPEFGTIAMIVLAVSIVSILAVSAKSRLAIPKI